MRPGGSTGPVPATEARLATAAPQTLSSFRSRTSEQQMKILEISARAVSDWNERGLTPGPLALYDESLFSEGGEE